MVGLVRVIGVVVVNWVGGVGLVKKLTVTQKAKRKSGRGKKVQLDQPGW